MPAKGLDEAIPPDYHFDQSFRRRFEIQASPDHEHPFPRLLRSKTSNTARKTQYRGKQNSPPSSWYLPITGGFPSITMEERSLDDPVYHGNVSASHTISKQVETDDRPRSSQEDPVPQDGEGEPSLLGHGYPLEDNIPVSGPRSKLRASLTAVVGGPGTAK